MFSDRTGWKLTRNRFSKVQDQILNSTGEVLDLTVSNPTRVGLDFDRKTIIDALTSPAVLDYDPQPKGLLAARAAVADYYRSKPSTVEVDPASIVLTTSTSEGYSYVLRLLANPGDEILVPRPSYPLFQFLADLQDVKLVAYPLIYDHGWQIDFPSLYRAVHERTRAVIVVHPNNPTGSYVSAAEQRELNELCHRHDLALIVDEVFLDYVHHGPQPPSFVSNQEVLTFTLSGLSKICALPQMKVAWIVTTGPQELARVAMERMEIIADTFLSMNAPLQLATPALLHERKNIQPALLERVRRNLSELDAKLAVHPGCRRLEVEGGWYSVLRVPVTQSDEDLAIKILREKSVLVHPGHFYDFMQEGHLILSLITPPRQFQDGLKRIFEFPEMN